MVGRLTCLDPVDQTEAIGLVVNKTIVSEREGKGRRGYGRRPAVKLLVYAQLKGIHKDETLEKHLRNNPKIRKGLGLKGVPDRTTIGRWKRRYEFVAKEAFEELAELIGIIVPSELLVVDSTPLEDPWDPDARVGFYSRGPFKGFKVHVSVDQLGLPRKALVTPGNKHDSPFLPELISGQEAKYVIADAGYDSKCNRKACMEIGAKPHIATNPRRSGRRRYTPPLCARKHYIVEQFNSRLKDMLNGCWQKVRGLAKKATLVYTALIAMLVIALQALLLGRPSLLRKISLYR